MIEDIGAYCDACGWEGLMADLHGDVNSDVLVELCPECHSSDTWWGTPEE